MGQSEVIDVTLPNGTVISGVPADVSKEDIKAKAIANGLATEADFYVEPEKTDGFFTGLGSGLVGTGRQVGNLVGLDHIGADWASDEAIAAQEERDKALTGWGQTGKFIGELAATLPIGFGVGGLAAKGALTAAKAGRAGKVLSATLGGAVGQSAVEGAAIGSVLGGPENRVGGALGGAAFSGLATQGGKVLGKALGKGTAVKQTSEAKELQDMTKHFIPLSQSAEPGLVKQIYNAFLANLPGVGGKVRKQYQDALDDMRRYAGELAMPDTPHAHSIVKLTGDESVEEMIEKLTLYWGDDVQGIASQAFDPIKSVVFNTFKTDAPPKWLQKEILKGGKGLVKWPVAGGKITGEDLLTLKTELGTIISKLNPAAKAEAKKYLNSIDKLMKRNLDPTGKGKGKYAEMYRNYEAAVDKYPAWMAFKSATKKAVDHMNFSPAQLAKAGARNVHPARKNREQVVGELGVTALENFPSRQGLFQTLAAVGPFASAGAGFMAGGPAGAAMAVAGAIVAGRVAASKGLQKYLSGQTAWQKTNKALMEKYSKELQALGLSARDAALVLGFGNAER